ncbi:MAG TPA: DUF350 domain-containing protein [Stenotrophobium sp.]|nr:DUF350 domain-containing protein [Stenotrophobium sp.]
MQLDPIVLNFIYAALGGLLMLAGGWLAYRVFMNVAGFDIRVELQKGNIAVGLALMGLFIAVGIGMGLVIGLSLN